MIIAILFGLLIISYLSYPAFPFIKEYFEVQRTKLELAKPEKVDSLLNVIAFQDSIVQNYYRDIDSLMKDTKLIVDQMKQEMKELETEKRKLIETVNSQAQTISKFNN